VATYKLIQDIEAEDHILGPLTLRQFIFALIAIFSFYMCFIAFSKHFVVLWAFILPGIFFGFFAMPFGRDQPTEIWFLAKLRFWFKPRRRIWDQSGVKELVTITVPKKIERVLTDGLSQTEVKSRLSALANTIDSRGWAIKNVNINSFANPNPVVAMASDRLINIDSIPQEVPSFDVQASDDILDETSNPLAQQFDQMITQSAQTHHQSLVSQMNGPADAAPSGQPAQPSDYWFMHSAQQATPAVDDNHGQQASLPNPDEAALVAQLKARHPNAASYSHLRTLRPMDNARPNPAALAPQASGTNQAAPAVTADPDPAILPLVSNNDLSVATIAREAAKAKGKDLDDEVVISLR
jgi:hypothetical protein